jgi:hypothetical protein
MYLWLGTLATALALRALLTHKFALSDRAPGFAAAAYLLHGFRTDGIANIISGACLIAQSVSTMLLSLFPAHFSCGNARASNHEAL